MQFDLPRRQRKSFEVITKTALSDKLNKDQAIEIFNKIKKEYENSPNTFGSSSGKKESVMELLVIVGNQIAGEYKDCLLYTSPSPRDRTRSRMPSSA